MEGNGETARQVTGLPSIRLRETLNKSSFRVQRSEDPESSAFEIADDWIPAFAGMTS
jgi:hypothetical protein